MNDKDKSFSERYGYKQPKPFQKEEMDDDLRNGLWNVFYESFIQSLYHIHSNVTSYRHPIYREVFVNFLNRPIDEYDHFHVGGIFVKGVYQREQPYKVYDLIEFVIQYLARQGAVKKNEFIRACNDVLTQENSAYRIVEGLVVPVIDKQEIAEIETALKTSAKGCLEKSLALFSDRENPDYENSIKESIHAVESIAKEITRKEKSLNALTQELKLHPNLTNALNELYNWTSKDGIRHGKSDKPLSVNQDTARFMLVTCSAFVNYVIVRNSETK